MRVLVCGGRNYRDYETLSSVLSGIRPSIVIDGGARGADWMASSWALENGVHSVTYKADWNAHGKAAGPMRNRRMIVEGKPDIVVAFPGGKGTEDMISKARSAGIKLHIVPTCNAEPTHPERNTK